MTRNRLSVIDDNFTLISRNLIASFCHIGQNTRYPIVFGFDLQLWVFALFIPNALDFFSRVYECNSSCLCSVRCGNRSVQNGIRLKLLVSKTATKGWSLKTLEDIQKGTFIGSYSGMVYKEAEFYKLHLHEVERLFSVFGSFSPSFTKSPCKSSPPVIILRVSLKGMNGHSKCL